MVLGKLPVLGRPTIWVIVGQGPTALAVGAGGGCLDIFTLLYLFSPLSPSLWETARYRLKYCLKGPLNPKQPTNQPTYRYAEHLQNVVDGYNKSKHSSLKNLAPTDVLKQMRPLFGILCIMLNQTCNQNYPSVEPKIPRLSNLK